MVSGIKQHGVAAAADTANHGASDNNPSPTSEEKMKVVVRVRPLQAKEESWTSETETDKRQVASDANPPATMTIQGNEMMWEKNGQLKILKADAVFTNGASQDSVYHSVSECVDALIAGFDCSVFAYGQTGTGKTYTMSGLQRDESINNDVSAPIPASHGVVPRSIERLFVEMEREKRRAVGSSFSVYCSFIEIYNEKIYDILSPENQSQDAKTAATVKGSVTHRARWNGAVSAKDAKCLQIRQKLDGSVFVDGMTSRNVGSKEELLQAFREGSLHREVRDNLYNQFSSRGHAVFQITLRKTIADNDSSKASSKKTRLSRLYFVDLAGSEKWHVSGSDLTDKYASELASINKSLSALTNCVMALTQKERSHVPFRDSILTRLLQSCLQGSGRTAFIVTISPSKGSMEESFATLRFAERLKAIRCRPVRRGLFSNEMLGEQRLYYERQIQVMRDEVNRLRGLLRKANQRPTGSEAVGSLSKDANAALVEENRRLKELLLQSERSRLVERSERASKGGKTSITGAATARMSPQQFSARQMLKPTSMEDDNARNGQTKNASEQIGDDGSKADQLTTLETQLQSKEARLNWMLEAEMEAQNAGTGVDTDDSTPTDPTRRPTVTRSWAVETRLRRQLVQVPPQLREAQPDSGSDEKKLAKSAVDQCERIPAKRVLPVNVEASPSPARVTDQPPLQQSPRNPGRRHTRSLPTEPHINGASAGRNRDTFARPHQAGSSKLNGQPDQAKAASILKLVGSGSVDTSGRTRDELIEDYKHARRVELEAMMRTMVQK